MCTKYQSSAISFKFLILVVGADPGPTYTVFPAQISARDFKTAVEESCKCVAKARKNLFNLPSGMQGKEFVSELTFWYKPANNQIKLSSVAMKAIMILPSLILQKPDRNSKTKEHSECMDRHINWRRTGEQEKLLR